MYTQAIDLNSLAYDVLVYQCFCMTRAALFLVSDSTLAFQLRRESTCT